MKTKLTLLWLFTAMVAAAVPARPENTGTVVMVDPALREIVPADAKIEKLAGGFKFTEGPVWAHAGYLLFSDIPQKRINKWTPDGKVKAFLKAGDNPGTKSFVDLSFDSNGLTLDRQGRLTICEQTNRRVSRLEKDGRLTVLADKYEGGRFSSPNDLVYKSDGALYFTDPPYGLPQGDDDPGKELKFNGVYRLMNGRLQVLIKDLTRPNGLAFSPDEKFFYVAVSDPAKEIWMRYDVEADGTVANGQVFFDVTSSTEDGLPDGMKVDQKGNVYGTGPGGIWIFSPAGKHLGTIKPPEVTANCAWGDGDGKTLYMTASTGLYRIRLKIAGVRP